MRLPARFTTICTVAVLLLVAPQAGAQDLVDGENGDTLDEALRELADRALDVHITARITEAGGEESVWDMEVTRVTISGRAVTVRLDGSNVTVVATFTPYTQSDDSILLVAQGQTWVSRGDDEREVSYQTALESMPIELGEPVVFLPLGGNALTMDVEDPDWTSEETSSFNIELEVTVAPYTGDAADDE
ncbi:MAG: hypothetical protein ACLFM6_00620 [Spirochaetaceae bacterium]